MRILLIEDNTAIAGAIEQFLQLEGWDVDVVGDGAQGLEQASTYTYDCIVLDVMLPSMDGFSILKKLRLTKKTPVIMTTAKGQLDDKAEGFDGGADDYLVKPFELKELVMRIKSLVKRSEISDIYTRKDIEIDFDSNTVKKSGTSIDLTLKERHLLTLLVEAGGSVVQRATIIDEIWGDTGIWDSKNDAKLDVYIANLRKKIDKQFIETIKGLGYKIAAST